jgi:hypothetical protein
MKRVVFTVTAVVVLAAVMVVVQDCAVLGGPPTGIQVGADTDSTIQVVWSAPAEGNPDGYLLYFKPQGESSFALVFETQATSYVHNPEGRTGTYKVTAKFGSETFDATTLPTTVPVHGDTVTLAELNVDSNRSGYGWKRDNGTGGVFSMAAVASAADVDFYISDLDTGFGRTPYVIISPNQADTFDRGAVGVIPSADWRMNGFTPRSALPSEPASLPSYSPPPNPSYWEYTELTGEPPVFVGCYTAGEQEKHYALIKVLSVDAQHGLVKLESWYQLVAGLRLIRH